MVGIATTDEIEALLEEISKLSTLVLRIARLVHVRDDPMTATHRLALIEICDGGPMRIQTLAQCMQTTSPTVTRAVDALEAEGLVERSRDPRDGRGVLVRPTQRGTRWASRRRAALYNVISQVPSGAMPRRLIEDIARLNRELGILTGPRDLPADGQRALTPRGHLHG